MWMREETAIRDLTYIERAIIKYGHIFARFIDEGKLAREVNIFSVGYCYASMEPLEEINEKTTVKVFIAKNKYSIMSFNSPLIAQLLCKATHVTPHNCAKCCKINNNKKVIVHAVNGAACLDCPAVWLCIDCRSVEYGDVVGRFVKMSSEWHNPAPINAVSLCKQAAQLSSVYKVGNNCYNCGKAARSIYLMFDFGIKCFAACDLRCAEAIYAAQSLLCVMCNRRSAKLWANAKFDEYGGEMMIYPCCSEKCREMSVLRDYEEKFLEEFRSYNCNYCGECDAELSNCARCKKVFYCGTRCQKKDWKTHKSICKI